MAHVSGNREDKEGNGRHSLPYKVGDIIFEEYQLEKILGSGGFGTVFASINLVTQQQVVIKIEHSSKRVGLNEKCADQILQKVPGIPGLFDFK